MSKNRIKFVGPAIKSRAEMEALARKIAEAKIEQQSLTAAMDAAITAARETFEGRLGCLSEKIEGQMALAQSWAEANPAEFGQAKSIDMVHAVIGFRTGTPKLKTLAGWTFDRVLQYLRDAGLMKFIRVKEEVDKERLIASREQLLDGDYRAMGVRIVQEESFYVEPKLTEVEVRETGK